MKYVCKICGFIYDEATDTKLIMNFITGDSKISER